MIDEEKNTEPQPENPISDKANELINKGKELSDQVEDFFEEKVDKVKSSETFGKISGFFDKVEDFMEERAEQFHSGELEAKIEAFKARAEDQADELISRVKEAGLKIGDSVEQTIDILKGKKDQPTNQAGGGI